MDTFYPRSHQGQGKFPACGLGLRRVCRGERARACTRVNGPRSKACWEGLGYTCVPPRPVSVYDSLGTAAAVTPVCCDPRGNAPDRAALCDEAAVVPQRKSRVTPSVR